MSLGNKQIMANNIKRLLEQRGLNPRQMAIELDFKYTTVLDWVNAKTYPRIDKVEMMANFFNVAKSDLVEEYDSNKKNTVVASDGREVDLSNLREKVVMFDGKPLSDDDVDKITQIIKLSLGVTDIENK